MISEGTPLRTLRRLQALSLEDQKNSSSPSNSGIDLIVQVPMRHFASTVSSASTTPLSQSPMIHERQVISSAYPATPDSLMLHDPIPFGHSPAQEYQKLSPAEPIKEENHLIEEGQIKAVIRTIA